MKLIIQIPCFNEADSLPVTLAALPPSLPGISVEWLVIDDGSSDNTAAVAKAQGVHHIVSLRFNQGLARAFMAGIEACLFAGADIIVNTDADNQYDANDIPSLIHPILTNQAQVVIGARPISKITHFSMAKKIMQKLGSWAVKLASGTNIPDAPSGFRAFSREAALRLYVYNTYTYTIETIIQSGRKNIPITWVPVKVNNFLRPSRLITSIPAYIFKSVVTIFRVFILYEPIRFFSTIATIIAVPGLLVLSRFTWVYFFGSGSGHVQSLVIGSTLLAVAAIIFVGGILADLIAANRLLLEDMRTKVLRNETKRANEIRYDKQEA